MSTDNDFKRGSKGSSAIMTADVTPEQVAQFMRTSFYLPVDILKSKDWRVYPITVHSGSRFGQLYSRDEVHCLEDYYLLRTANFVAVSSRWNPETNEQCYVAKIWYGAAPKDQS